MTNPIIQRELVTSLRSMKSLLILVGLVIALGTLVVLRWPSGAQVTDPSLLLGSGGGSQSQQVLSVFGYGLMTGLLLLAPAFPAASIVRERRSGTLALLLNSPMGPWSIFFGKLLGVVGLVVLLIVVSIPAATACYGMGGVSLTAQLLPMYVVLFALAVQYASMGLLVSSIAGTTDAALRMTYGVVLTMAVLTLGPYQFLRGLAGETGLTHILEWIRCLSPIPAMMELLGHNDIGAGGLMASGGTVSRYLVLAVITILVCSAWTIARLGGWMLDRPRDQGKITDDRSAKVKAYRRIMYLWFFDPQRRSGLIGPMTNPVMIKEFRCRRFGRGNWMMRLIAGCALVSLALALFATRTAQAQVEQQAGNVATMGAIMVILQVALIVLLSPSLAAGLISTERESGGWQLLQVTSLSPMSIVLGKLMSAGWTVLLILLATLPGYVVMIVIDSSQKQRVVKVLVSLSLTAVFAVLSSAMVSSCVRRTAAATATAYVLILALCAGTMLFWLGQDAPFTRDVVEWVLLFNPLAGALQLIEAPGFADYHLIPGNWWIMGASCMACLLLLIYRTWRLTRPV